MSENWRYIRLHSTDNNVCVELLRLCSGDPQHPWMLGMAMAMAIHHGTTSSTAAAGHLM